MILRLFDPPVADTVCFVFLEFVITFVIRLSLQLVYHRQVFPVPDLASYQVHIQVDNTKMTMSDPVLHGKSQSGKLGDMEMIS